jgi:hypothetical protein
MFIVVALSVCHVQSLESALSSARQTICQLRAAAASSEADTQATDSSLLSELAEKSSQLVDAERRFSEMEAMMQRIASRTGQGQGLAFEGLSGLRSSFGDYALEPHYQQQQQPPLRSSWGAQQYQQCGVGVDGGPAAAGCYSPVRSCKLPC